MSRKARKLLTHKTRSCEPDICLAPPRARDPQLWHRSCPSSNVSLSLTGDKPVNTISINQVLSNVNLISYNKFVQVQGCEEKVGMAADSEGDRV